MQRLASTAANHSPTHPPTMVSADVLPIKRNTAMLRPAEGTMGSVAAGQGRAGHARVDNQRRRARTHVPLPPPHTARQAGPEQQQCAPWQPSVL